MAPKIVWEDLVGLNTHYSKRGVSIGKYPVYRGI